MGNTRFQAFALFFPALCENTLKNVALPPFCFVESMSEPAEHASGAP
jgi:hypothetical protein